MLPIYVDQKFSYGWATRKTGAATVDVTNGVLRTFSNVTGESAMKDYYFPIQPGQVIEVEVWAKDNGSSVKPRIALDAFKALGDFTLLDYVEVEQNKQWGLYKLTVAVPFTETKPYARLSLGKWGSMTAVDCSYKQPVIRVSNAIGVTRTIAMGLIRMESGVPSLHDSFRTSGIKSMNYDATGKYLDVIVDYVLPDDASLLGFPVPFVCTTGDNVVIAQAGNVVSESGGTRVRIRWTDGTQNIDVATKGTVYTNFKLEI